MPCNYKHQIRRLILFRNAIFVLTSARVVSALAEEGVLALLVLSRILLCYASIKMLVKGQNGLGIFSSQ